MIVVRVELWSAATGKMTELARMSISNIGGTKSRGDYAVETYVGRDREALNSAMRPKFLGSDERSRVARKGEVKGHARLSVHVWNLVAKALAATNYG